LILRLVGLHIDGYGIFRDFTVGRSDLDGAPVIIYGLNEAGKSTFLSFIRGVLFGFKAEGSRPWPVRGGRVGGWLLLENDAGEVFRVERTGKRDGKVVVELPDGTKEGEACLRSRILGGISPVLFKNVFAIGMDELRKLDDLKREEVSAHIYGAGTGVSPDKLTRAINTLQTSARDLFNPRGRVQEINKLLKELRDTDRQIKKLEQQPACYWKLKDGQAALEGMQASLGRKRKELELRRNRLENLIKARDPWVKMQNLISQLKELQPVKSFPPDGLSRLEKLLERRNHKKEEVRRCETTIRDLRERLESSAVNEAILEYGPVIRGLSSEKSLYVEKGQKLAEEEIRLRQLKELVQERLANLGSGWDEERVLKLDLSLTVHRQAEEFGQRFRMQEDELKNISRVRESRQEDVDRGQKGLREIENKLSGLPVYSKKPVSLNERFTVLEQLNSNLQQVHTTEAKIEGEKRRYRDLQARKDFAKNNLDDGLSYRKFGWIAWVVAALGITGFFVTGLNAGGFLLLAGSIGLALLIKGILNKMRSEASARREHFHREVEMLEQELEQIGANLAKLEDQLVSTRKKIETAALKLNYGPDITSNDLPEIRRRLEQEREEQRFRKQLEEEKKKAEKVLHEARSRLETLKRREATKQEEIGQLEEEWQQWCAGKGLPHLKPAGIVSFLHLAEKARDAVNKLRISREEYRQVAKFVDDYVDRVNAVAENLDMEPVDRNSAGSRVVRLAAALEEQEAQANLRRNLEGQLEKARADLELASAGLEEVQNSIKELLVLGEAADEDDFRARAGVFAGRERIRRDIESVKEHLLSIAGSPRELEEFYAELKGSRREDNLKELEQVKQELNHVDKKINDISNDIAEKRLQIKEIESGEELARARQERDMLRERLVEKTRQWRVLTLCSTLLDMAKEKHERDRQPGVLLKAASYLGSMTGGRYARVIAPVGSPGQLEVEEPHGGRVEVANLSRGAANQLYLSLRLALAEHYSSVVAPLPVMLDDIMVDFDHERLAGAMKVLREISTERQVLFFTCHRHILEMISELLPEHKCITLGEGTMGGDIT